MDVADSGVIVVDCIDSGIVVSVLQVEVVVIAQVHSQHQKDQTKIVPVSPEVALEVPKPSEKKCNKDSEPVLRSGVIVLDRKFFILSEVCI